jgi:GT2 family glycosyltransferase
MTNERSAHSEPEANPIALSIVILSYNAKTELEHCLASLHASGLGASWEIIVVDNASSDGSATAARAWPGVRVIEAGRNGGFAVGNNIGIRASHGRAVLLLNSDTLVPPGALDRLLAELERRPEVAVVGPRLVDKSGVAELSFGPMLTPLSELRQMRLRRGLERRDPAAVAAVEAMTSKEQFPDWVSGACLLVRRADADAVGLLDERFFMYTEDVDFCAAIRARGRRVLFAPSVEIVHLRGRSGASNPSETRAAYERSHLAFYRKHHPQLVPLIWLYRRLGF